MTDYSEVLASLSPEKRALLMLRLKKAQVTAPKRIPRRPDPAAPAPLSFAQERFWFLNQFDSGSAYNDRVGFLLTGALDLGIFAASFDEIRRRHETLRSVFPLLDGKPVQAVKPWAPMSPPLMDLSALPPRARETEWRRLALEEGGRPFRLESETGLRVTLLRFAPAEHVLLVTMHHIVTDGWSWEVLLREFALSYNALGNGLRPSLPDLPIQYADFAAWQRATAEQEALATETAWWTERLAGAPPRLELPADRPRPARQSFRGANLPFELPAPACTGLREVCRSSEATLFMGLLAAFQGLLGRYARQEDVVVGSPVAGRNRPETETLIGVFVNTLPLRGDLRGEPSFRELLGRTRRMVMEAFTHQELPFERLVEALGVERNLSYAPVFQVLMAVQNTTRGTVDLSSLQASPLHLPGRVAKLDLELAFVDWPGSLAGSLEYSTDLFDGPTVQRMVRHLAVLLQEAVAGPGRRLCDLPLLTEPERAQLLLEWTDTAKACPQVPMVHELVASQAALRPEATAVAGAQGRLTYAELDARANRLAHRLRALGVGREVRVAICTDRTLDRVVGILGAVKAGGAYVSLDPTYPRERLAYLLEDAGAPVLLTERRFLDRLPKSGVVVICLDGSWDQIRGDESAPPESGVAPENLAYVVYTSGSTGKPKGVQIPHAGLMNLVRWHQDLYRVSCEDRGTQVASPAFDASIWELWPYLTAGASLHIPDEETRLSAEKMIRWWAQEGITLAYLMTPLAEAVLEAKVPRDLELKVRALIIGGDRLRRRPASGTPFRLMNHYGPAEYTVTSTVIAVPPLEEQEGAVLPTIGRAVDNTRIYVLDAQGQPVPIGAPGELYVGGIGLARGYLGRPDLTAEKFVPDPFAALHGEPGARLYRTADLVRWLPDGDLDFLGRLDNQVKVRGLRIELGEIEAELCQHPSIREAVVLVREDALGVWQLVAYPVFDLESSPSVAEVRQFLRQQLPEYMVPAFFVPLSELPLTPNGKVDRRALPPPTVQGEKTPAAPRNSLEELIAGIWAEVLGQDSVGMRDNFFEIGGHSLLATQIMSRVRSAFGMELPLASLFEAPTLDAFAERVERAHSGAALPVPPLRRMRRDGRLPLSFAQQRLWFLQQLEPNDPSFNISLAVLLAGPLDVAALSAALDEIVGRHEVLRTTFRREGEETIQVIGDPVPGLLPLVDLSGLKATVREPELRRLRRGHGLRPMDLERGPLFEFVLLRLDEEQHALFAILHHIISDGWSQGILVRELAEIYRAFAAGRPSPLPEPPLQYADFAVWQRQWLQGDLLDSHIEWWRERLEGAPAVLRLPTDRPRPDSRSFYGASLSRSIAAVLAGDLRALARREGATLFMTLAAAFQILLHAYSGQDDIVLGSDVANRDRTELEGLIGLFVNQLALRVRFQGDPTFSELLAQVRALTLEAHAHRDLPFEKLVEVLRPERTLGTAPLFQVKLNLHYRPPAVPEIPGLSLAPLPGDRVTAQLDLILNVLETREGLDTVLEYSTDVFERRTAARILESFERVLDEVARRPAVRLSELREALAAAAQESEAREEMQLETARLQMFRRQARRPVRESATP